MCGANRLTMTPLFFLCTDPSRRSLRAVERFGSVQGAEPDSSRRLDKVGMRITLRPMKNTVKSKQDMDRIFTKGVKASCPSVMVLALPTPEGTNAPAGRVAFVAGKKLGSAPVRNRSKRVLREAARRAGAPWPGRDVVFVARRDTATCGLADLESQCRRCLVKAGVIEGRDESRGRR